MRKAVEAHLQEAFDTTRVALPSAVRAGLMREILNELFGFGPIQPLLDDPTVSEVMVNGPHRRVYAEREREAEKTESSSATTITSRVIETDHPPAGPESVHAKAPMVDARLPGRLARQRRHRPLRSRWAFHHHPKIRQGEADRRRPGQVRQHHAAGGGFPQGVRRFAAEHRGLRRHGVGQDDPAERPLQLHPRR